MNEETLKAFLRDFAAVHVPKYASPTSGYELATRPFQLFLGSEIPATRFYEILCEAMHEVEMEHLGASE